MTIPIYRVQHPDKTAGAKTFANEPAGSLYVRSHFETLQGEGPWAGEHTYFIRLAGCNYGTKTTHCQFCDTDFRMSEGKRMQFNELQDLWLSARTTKVVITGGEPLLQGNLLSFVDEFPASHFQIETNGSQLAMTVAMASRDNVTVVCSPKWSKTGAIITPVPMMLETVTFKFLVSADEDSYEWDLPGWAYILTNPFYISPMAVYKEGYNGEVVNAWDPNIVDHKRTAENYAYAAQKVIELNKRGLEARLSIQQHLFTRIP